MARVLKPSSAALPGGHNRSTSTTSAKKEIWSTLLSSVASSKRTPEKHLFVLGGTQAAQRDFIEALAPTPAARKRHHGRAEPRPIPLANAFALGYTYRDILSSDGEDTLARVSIHILSSPNPGFAPLLQHALTGADLHDSALAILLDWERPWTFATELRAWIRLWRSCVAADAAPDNDMLWRSWRDGTEEGAPLGQGEYDEPLGVPTVVVCVNTRAVEKLERDKTYKEADFDFVMQFLRTVGLKHGAGLMYTMPGQPGQVAGLVQRMLQIGDTLIGERGGEQALKHNVIDRDRVFVPPGWDSWGKIRVLREGFDIEGTSQAWGVDIQAPLETQPARADDAEEGDKASTQAITEGVYAERIWDPTPVNDAPIKIEVEHTPDQAFLATQLERLEVFLAEDEAAKKQRARRPADDGAGSPSTNDQMGPVQFNMGGIRYDAAEALRRIKERNKATVGTSTPTQATPERSRTTRESTPFTPGSPPAFEPGKDIPVENLEAYFASLMKGGRSAVNSPRVATGSPKVTRDGQSQGES